MINVVNTVINSEHRDYHHSPINMATILCIDDDPRILQLHKAVLGTKGYTVLTAPDGVTGIAMTRTHAIDVVITDYQMPGINGSQVAHRLSKEKPKLPVVIYSGCVDIPKRLKCFVLSKAHGPERLLSMVEGLIQLNCERENKAARKKCGSLWHKKAS
jgi:CheY-like chemotaxis protein